MVVSPADALNALAQFGIRRHEAADATRSASNTAGSVALRVATAGHSPNRAPNAFSGRAHSSAFKTALRRHDGYASSCNLYATVYTGLMFEWDDAKRQQTIERRGLDFIAATLIFDGRPVVTALAANFVEPRFVTTAILNDGKYYTVIWTWRGEAHRIISFRRARHGEERAHRALHTR